MNEPMRHDPMLPGIRPTENEYGEHWHPPDPPKPTTWATEPPPSVSLTLEERRVRDQLEERRRSNEAQTNGFTAAVRAAQDRRAAELAARYALPAGELHELLEEYREALTPFRVAITEAAERHARAQADRDRGAAFAERATVELERLESAEAAAVDQHARACAEAISNGEDPGPYEPGVDAAALHAARIEARAASEALRRLEDSVNVAASGLDGPRRELEAAVDRLIYDRLIAAKIERLRTAFAEVQQLRPLLWGYKAAGMRDLRFAADTADLDAALDIKPVMPGQLPEPVERALHEWRQRREVLIASTDPGA